MNEEDSLAVVSGPSTGHWMCSRETGNVPGQPSCRIPHVCVPR